MTNRPESDPSSQDGATAVITGASSGIGEVYARRLAAKGLDLLLVARREERLRELSRQLHDESGVEAAVHVADLASPQDVQRLATHLAEMPCVRYLVNSAGFGTMGRFVDVGLQRHLDMVRVHVLAPIELTHAVLPQMVARRSGYIINVSSMSAFLIGPGQVTYAATKSLLKSFSESLQAELQDTGVRVQAVCPGMTYTGFHDTAEFKDFDRSQMSKRLWMSAEAVVDASLRDLKRGRVVCVPGLKNKLLATLFRVGVMRAVAGKAVEKKPKP